MDFEISPEQEELCASVRQVLERECELSAVRGLVERGVAPEQPWRSARELGWTAITVPERLGGLGLGFVELALVMEEHGRFLAPGPLLATLSQFAPLVSEAGSPAQQEKWLGAVAAGELAGTLAVADAAGDWHAPQASLRAQRDGDAFVLDGVRHHVVEAEAADEIGVVAAVDAGDGVGLFVVPRAAAKTRAITPLDASRPLAAVELHGVRVGPERTLGTPGRSAPALRRVLEEATVALALEMVGTCQALFDATLEYARHREQFGRPIGSFQAIQHKLADCFIALEKARATGYFAALALAEDDARRGLAASLAKAQAGACQRRIAREAIQIHGGIGFTWEHDTHLFVKRVKSGDALFGSAAVHRARIAAHLGV